MPKTNRDQFRRLLRPQRAPVFQNPDHQTALSEKLRREYARMAASGVILPLVGDALSDSMMDGDRPRPKLNRFFLSLTFVSCSVIIGIFAHQYHTARSIWARAQKNLASFNTMIVTIKPAADQAGEAAPERTF